MSPTGPQSPATGQLGRIFENLVENTYTAGSEGRLVSYLPVLDSRGVDRAISLDGGAPLYLQVKGHLHSRQGGRLSYSIPLTEVGAYRRWIAALVSGSPDGLAAAYLVPGADLLRLGARGHLVDGRPCLRLTVSPTSPTWQPYEVPPPVIGPRLLQLAGPGHAAARLRLEEAELAAERQQEEGAYFEAAITAALLGASDQLVLYRPAVDLAGRDLLAQLAGSDAYLYLQIKGTTRLDVPDHPHFQVRRRTFVADPRVIYLFAYRDPTGTLGPVWAVDAVELNEHSSTADLDHISFEPRLQSDDRRWGHRRLDPDTLASVLLERLTPGS